jgi:light-regulated signal transduction histidine kinase (bacteriophytochrome)
VREQRTLARARAAEAESARARAELERFAHLAAHDLSEPLRIVAGFVELLQRRDRGRLDGEADEFIEHALQGTRRMQERIDELAERSRRAA